MRTTFDIIFDKFGGTERKLADALGHKHVTRIRYWRQLGCVPGQGNQKEVMAASERLGAGVEPTDFIVHLTGAQQGQEEGTR